MKRRWLLLILLVAGPGLVWGQTRLLGQQFDDEWATQFPPIGWRIAYTGQAGNSDWHRAPDGGVNPWEANPTPYALIARDPGKVISDSLISPSFSAEMSGTVTLYCSSFVVTGSGAFQMEIRGSTDGGFSWPHLVRTYGQRESLPPTRETFVLTWAANRINCKLAWIYTGDTRNISFWALDNVTVIGSPTQADVGTARIVAPRGLLDSGASVNPEAVVRNYGTVPARFNARLRIGASYEDLRSVDNLAGGESLRITFAQWTALGRGVSFVTCSTELSGDVNTGNDRVRDSVIVGIQDAYVARLLAPRDTVDSGYALTPQADVTNGGTRMASFPVLLRIADSYIDTQLVANLPAGETQTVSFRQFYGCPRYTQLARCSTMLEGDAAPGNDEQLNVIYGRVTDVGVLGIIAPRGILPESTAVVPKAFVVNHGSTVAVCEVLMRIVRDEDTIYAESFQTPPIQPGALDSAWFTLWFAMNPGRYRSCVRTVMDRDVNPDNDLDTVSFFVGFHNVGVTEIWEPRMATVQGQIQPRLRIRNHGQTVETFFAKMRASNSGGTIYEDSTLVPALQPRETRTVYLPIWDAQPGRYLVLCSTALNRDAIPEDDARQESTVVTLGPAGWSQLADMPPGSRAKAVKGGGRLCSDGDSLVFAFKGNNRDEFYAYDTRQSMWTTRCSIPYSSTARKRVGKGGSLAWSESDHQVYALKGGGTLEFWAYDPIANAWQQRSSVPGDRKKVKGGAALVYVPSRRQCYAFKGGNTAEFYAYDIQRDLWITKPEIGVPPGARAKRVKDGGSLTFAVSDADTVLYALKGGGVHEYWRYEIARDSWIYTDSMPFATARRVKVGDGAALAWNGMDRVYALKGNKSLECWIYSLAPTGGNRWQAAPDLGGGVPVKSGGSLCYARGMFYALKGNNTREFWSFIEVPALGTAEPDGPRQQTAGEPLAIWPNPFRAALNVRISAPPRRPLSLRIYDAAGRVVRNLAVPPAAQPGQPVTVSWNGDDEHGAPLPSGVYLLDRSDQPAARHKLLLLR